MQSRGLPYTGLAALKIVSKALPDSLGGKALRREFAKKLVSMRGLPMKMAQVLSMSKDDTVSSLQKEALTEIDSAPRHEVIARLQVLAPDLLGRVAHFSEEAIVASLGQVHKVSMQDGRTCALKIKHAGIGPAMDLDTGLMGFMVSVFGHFKEGFAIDEYQKLLTQELRWELDYPYEISRQSDIYKVFGDTPSIVIPKPYPQESGHEHLLMDWETSVSIEKFAADATESERRDALNLLAIFHLHTIFRAGMSHADPNPGNFGLRRGATGIELVVYDYGSMVPLEHHLVHGFMSLVKDIKNQRDPLASLLMMGFLPDPLSAIQAQLISLCEILLEPFIQESEFLISGWYRSERIKALLGTKRWNLMVAAPPSLFFIMRAFHGLFLYSEILGGKLQISALMSQFLKAKAEVMGLKTSNEEQSKKHQNSIKTQLHVVLSKNGEVVVSLTMPGDAVNRLNEIMEPELLRCLKADGIDVMQVAGIAERNNYLAMQLFDWENDKKKVKVFLA